MPNNPGSDSVPLYCLAGVVALLSPIAGVYFGAQRFGRSPTRAHVVDIAVVVLAVERVVEPRGGIIPSFTTVRRYI